MIIIMIFQGIDVIENNSFNKLQNKKIALITNYSFVNKKMDDGIDLMFKNQVNVVKIFTPNMDYMAYLMEKNLMTKFILFTKYQLLAYMEK